MFLTTKLWAHSLKISGTSSHGLGDIISWAWGLVRFLAWTFVANTPVEWTPPKEIHFGFWLEIRLLLNWAWKHGGQTWCFGTPWVKFHLQLNLCNHFVWKGVRGFNREQNLDEWPQSVGNLPRDYRFWLQLWEARKSAWEASSAFTVFSITSGSLFLSLLMLARLSWCTFTDFDQSLCNTHAWVIASEQVPWVR